MRLLYCTALFEQPLIEYVFISTTEQTAYKQKSSFYSRESLSHLHGHLTIVRERNSIRNTQSGPHLLLFPQFFSSTPKSATPFGASILPAYPSSPTGPLLLPLLPLLPSLPLLLPPALPLPSPLNLINVVQDHLNLLLRHMVVPRYTSNHQHLSSCHNAKKTRTKMTNKKRDEYSRLSKYH